MKTRRISLITFLTLMMACFCIAIFGLKVNKANAAVVESVGYKDTFDSSEYTLSDSFKKIGNAKLKEDYTALRIKTDSYEWGAHIVNNQFKMNYDDINVGDSYVLELTVNVFDAGSWFSLSFGTIDPLYEFPHASGAFIFMNNFTELFVQQSNGALNTSGKNCDVNLFGGEPKDVTVIFTKTEESHIYDLKLNNRSLGEVYIFDGYFGFNSCTTSFDVTRFEISTLKGETKTLIFDDDFTSSSILYSSTGSSDAAWNASVHWDKNSALIGYISKLDLREDGSGIIYVNPFTKSTNEDLDVIYELSADFYTEEMENADCGFIIGADEDGNGGVFAGITNDGFSCYLKVGSEIKEMNFVNTMHLTLSVYADGRIVLSDGTIHVEAYSEKVEGYFGIKTVAENGVGAVVDEFAYNVYSYIDRKNDDVKTNFNDTTTKIMFNEEVPDFYLPSKYWHLGTGVKLPLYTSKTKENGYLKLSNASEFTCFGGKTKYTDFIVRFDVKMTDNIQSGNLIGIQFAKKQLSESSTNSTFIAFQCINLNGNYTTCYLSNKCVSTRGDNNGIIENLDNIFIADKVYNFMFIVKDGTATMHVKAEDEDESVLAIPRATFTNLDTDGYVAMFANGGIYLTLDNYSVTNLDYHYFDNTYTSGEDNALQTIRYDFSTITDISAFTETPTIKNKKLKISNESELETKDKVGSSIIRFNIAKLDEDLSFNHGDIKITMDRLDNSVKVFICGVEKKKIELPNGFEFDNSFIEIEEINNKLVVSYVSGNGHLMALNNNSFEIELDKTIARNSISFTTESDFGAYLGSLSVFNLDSNVQISTGEYTLEDVRKVREPIQGDDWAKNNNNNSTTDKAGCSGQISNIAIICPILMSLASVLIIKRKKETS